MSVNQNSSEREWDLVLKPKNRWYEIDLVGVWHYRDLVLLFVRQDFVSQYKQTILGPLWMVIQPLLTTLMFSIIFGTIAAIPTGGAPRLIFYLAAFVPWSYFSECFNRNAGTFTSNAAVFGKVYFPRLVRPISVMISSVYRFAVQALVFTIIYFIFFFQGARICPTTLIIFVPVLILMTGLYAMSMGLIVSSLTTKYRDLNFMTGVIIQLLMYGSSVVFAYADMPDNLKMYLKWNPLMWIMGAFRYATLGIGTWSWIGLAYSSVVLVFLLCVGIISFSKVEKSFMDTI